MEIKLIKNPITKEWTAVIREDGYGDQQTGPRAGCALREILNRFEYNIGKPSGDLVVTIEGW